jgi:Rrf2 family protein
MEFCLERARAHRKAVEEYKNEPVVIQRARIFERYLKEKSIHILEGELIVGNVTSKVRGGSFAPEMVNFVDKELDDPVRDFQVRPLDKFIVTPEQRKEIAKKENISLKYLEQVINPLRADGLVKAIRGAKGGYSLARPPAEICLYDLIETLEGPLSLLECLRDTKACPKVSSCVTREIWKEVSDAISKIFHSVTLEDMVNRRREKRSEFSSMYQI